MIIHLLLVSDSPTHVKLNFISLDEDGVYGMYQDTVGIDGGKKSLSHWNEFSRGPPEWLLLEHLM